MSDDKINGLLIAACIRHDVPHLQKPNGEVWFRLRGAEVVLDDLPPTVRTLGFETAVIEPNGQGWILIGHVTDHDPALTIAEALPQIANMPWDAASFPPGSERWIYGVFAVDR